LESLQKKTILFISPTFHDYYQEIISILRSEGANVIYCYDSQYDFSLIPYKLRYLGGNFSRFLFGIYYECIFSKINHIDYVFIIKGTSISLRIIKKIKNKFPAAKLIIYLWDSIRRIPNKSIESLLPCFDRVLTFDIEDYRKLKLNYLPLFYLSSFIVSNSNHEFDVAFVGTYHSDRLQILNSILEKIPLEFRCKIILCVGRKRYRRLKRKQALCRIDHRITFLKKAIPLEQVANIYSKSQIIIDIHHKEQTGLTMRTIECIAGNRKLITTNKEIVLHDFYNKHNILVINRNRVDIPITFLKEHVITISREIIKKYSLPNWIMNIFSGNTHSFLKED